MTKRLILLLACLSLAFTFQQPKPVASGPVAPAFKCAGAVTPGATTGTLACVQTGDWIVALSCGNVGTGTPTITCPTGFTAAGGLAGNADGNHEGQQACYKIATGTDTPSSTYTFTYNGTGTGFINSTIMDFRGGTTTLDQTAQRANTQSYMWTPPVTTTLRQDMVVMAWCAGATGNPRLWTDVPPGNTATVYQGSSAFDNGMYASYLVAPKPGTTPTQFATFTCGCSNGENTIAFGGTP